MPAVFVLIWSTGFVVARYGMPHAPPLSFLACALSRCRCWPSASGSRWRAAAWPRGRASGCTWRSTGVLMQPATSAASGRRSRRGIGGRHGGADRRPAAAADGVVAVSGDRQPARRIDAPAMGRAGRSGCAGLVLVVWHKLRLGEVNAVEPGAGAAWPCSASPPARCTRSASSQPCDVRTANAVQLLAALLVTRAAGVAGERGRCSCTPN